MSEMNLMRKKSVVWHPQKASEVARLLFVDPAQGLSNAEALNEHLFLGVARQRANTIHPRGNLSCHKESALERKA